MEFKQLEAFVAVVDYGSFSEAARRLYLTCLLYTSFLADIGSWNRIFLLTGNS